MNNSSQEAGIPLLTEIIAAPPADISVVHAPEPDQKESTDTLALQEISDWSDDEWDSAEYQIRERILQQVLEQINVSLEQRVRDGLAEVLPAAIAGLTNVIQGSLQQTLEEHITRSVAQEISRLQTIKK